MPSIVKGHFGSFAVFSYCCLLTLKIKGGSFRMHIESKNTNAGADEKSAVTSVADILIKAREYM